MEKIQFIPFRSGPSSVKLVVLDPSQIKPHPHILREILITKKRTSTNLIKRISHMDSSVLMKSLLGSLGILFLCKKVYDFVVMVNNNCFKTTVQLSNCSSCNRLILLPGGAHYKNSRETKNDEYVHICDGKNELKKADKDPGSAS